MADYIYTMEIRLTPDQQRGVTLVQDIVRDAGMNVYLTGGAVRDIISGFPIRDLDFTVQGNPAKLQKDLERAGVVIGGGDDDSKVLYIGLPGNVRAEISMARTERYEKVGKPPIVSPATIIEDLRRRDFTVNAMALSLNPGSRGLLMDPFNGAADIEAKVLRVLHNYAFVEDPSRLIRASRFAARFHWPLEERTQQRFDSARENNYIEYITDKAIGYEIEQLAYEEDPLHILRVLEKENWLKVLHPHWTTAKVDTTGLAQLLKTRQQMNELGYAPDPASAVMFKRHQRHAEADSAPGFGYRMARPRGSRERLGQAAHQQRGGNAVANLEAAFRSASGDDFVSRGDGPAAGCCTEDQKFLYQVAAGSAEDSVAGDDRAAHHATDARISQNCE